MSTEAGSQIVEKVLEPIPTELIFPLIVTVLGAFLLERHQKRRERADKVPRLRMIILDTAKTLKANHRTLEACSDLILFCKKVHKGMEERGDGYMVKFDTISYAELEKKVKNEKYVFMEFECENCDTLEIKHFLYQDRGFKETDHRVVPQYHDKNNNFGLVCPLKDLPDEISGESSGWTVKYRLASHGGTIVPKKGKPRRRRSLFRDNDDLE